MDNTLTSGVLRNALQDLFGNGEDEYQFENKEYLIMIEKDNISMSESTPIPMNTKAINAPQKNKSVIINKAINQVHTKNSDLIEPKCIPLNPFSYSIDILLGILDNRISSLKRPFPSSVEMPLPPTQSAISNASNQFSLTLPTYAEIRSKSTSFYSCSTHPVSTFPEYIQWIRETCHSVIRYTLFTGMS